MFLFAFTFKLLWLLSTASAVCVPSVHLVGEPTDPVENRQKIQTAIDDAVRSVTSGACGAEVILAHSKVYRLSYNSARYDALHIKPLLPSGSSPGQTYVRNITFNGNGSAIWVHPKNNALYMGYCLNCLVRDVKFIPIQPMNLQGIIRSVDHANKKIRIQISEQYWPQSVSLDEFTPGARPALGKPNLTIIFYEKKNWVMQNHLAHLRGVLAPFVVIKEVKIIDRNNRILEITADIDGGASTGLAATDATLAKVKVGSIAAMQSTLQNTAVLPNYGADTAFYVGDRFSALYLEANANLRLLNTKISDFVGGGVYLNRNIGDVTIDGLSFERRFTSTLLVNGSVGIMAMNNRGVITIRNSELRGLGDDSIDLHVMPEMATNLTTSVLPNDTVTLITWARGTIIRPGDTYIVRSHIDGKVLANLLVASVSRLNPNQFRVRFTNSIPSTVKLFQSGGAATADRFINDESSNKNSVIQNNLFIQSLRNGVLTGSSSTIQNNRFINLGTYAINVGIHDSGARPGLQTNTGVWGDMGQIFVRNNISDNVNLGFLASLNSFSTKTSANPKHQFLEISSNLMLNPERSTVITAQGTNGTSAQSYSVTNNIILQNVNDSRSIDSLIIGSEPIPPNGFTQRHFTTSELVQRQVLYDRLQFVNPEKLQEIYGVEE
ncbi:MAG: hypothetical protein M9962_13085 [Oligoflexia bacterium]|nr:hypothetical protein [Oligoflexia bacterium]